MVLSLGTDGSGYSTRNKHSGFRHRLQPQPLPDSQSQPRQQQALFDFDDDDDEVLKCIESEGTDRTSIALPSGQLELYRAVLV